MTYANIIKDLSFSYKTGIEFVTKKRDSILKEQLAVQVHLLTVDDATCFPRQSTVFFTLL
jgi:hypothetical protein